MARSTRAARLARAGLRPEVTHPQEPAPQEQPSPPLQAEAPLLDVDETALESPPESPPESPLEAPTALEILPPTPHPPASKKDTLGFPTDAQPHVTAAQLRWLTFRLESGDNAEACSLSGDDPLTVLTWLGDPEFFEVYQAALDNKREAFKTLSSHLLPAVIRSLDDLLRTGSNKDKKEASTLILRAQGLLVDKTGVVDPGSITALFSLLRQDQPVEARVLDMKSFRSMEPGES